MAKKSLVPTNPEPSTSTAVALPPGFEGAGGGRVAGGDGGFPYVSFASTKSKHWATHAAAIRDLAEGDPVLIRPGHEPVKLSPFRFHLVKWHQYYAITAQDGSLVKTWDEKPGKDAGKTDQYVDAICLVHTSAGIVVARLTFKGPKCQIASKGAAEHDKVSNVESWAKQSADHLVAARLPHPFMRYVVTGVPQPRRTSGSTGLPFVPYEGRVAPASAGDIKALSDFFADPKYNETLTAAADNLARRMEVVASKRG